MSVRLLVGLGLSLAVAVGVAADQAGDNGPVIPPANQGEQCVAPTDIMRREHMSLLNHQRDATVIDGVRDEPYSLVACVNCHAQFDTGGQPVRIDAKGQFCESCHSYAAVKIDCFSCHAALPEKEQAGKDQIIGRRTALPPVAANHSSQQLLVMQSHKVASAAMHELKKDD